MIKELAKTGNLPTLVIGLNDDTAMGAYLACHELGMQIGKDLSVIGFDNIPHTGTLSPGMTTVELFPRELGRQCAGELAGMLGSENSKPTKIKITPVLIERDSVSQR